MISNKLTWLLIFISLLLPKYCILEDVSQHRQINEWQRLQPTVVVCILARNKAAILPYFLGHLEDLDYPKDRISLFIRTDHNEDETRQTLDLWIKSVDEFYHIINYKAEEEDGLGFPDEIGPYHWSMSRTVHVLQLKQQALEFARQSWADYLFFVDCDVILSERRLLQSLIKTKRSVITPLLYGPSNDEMNFTNFFNHNLNQSDDYQYTFDFLFTRKSPGVYPIYGAHSAILIDMLDFRTTHLSFVRFDQPTESINIDNDQAFVNSLRHAGLRHYLDNRKIYGTIVPPMRHDLTDLQLDVENVRFVILESLNDGPPGFIYSPFLKPRMPSNVIRGLDKIFVINLERRPDKLERISSCFRVMDLNFSLIRAVDGMKISKEFIREHELKFLSGYTDPRSKRPITAGELGCFLSHYNIWTLIINDGLKRSIVFEDDVRFARYFRLMLQGLLSDLDANPDFEWDFIYLGRKILTNESNLKNSSKIPKSIRYLSPVGYSYWTIGYLISLNGAKKLVEAKPLLQVMPVDEFLPLMFGQHPNQEWNSRFSNRNLQAFTFDPLIVYPVRYTGQDGYITDTENSNIIQHVSTPSTSSLNNDHSQRTSDEL